MTLIETLLSAVMMAMVMLFLYKLTSGTFKFFARSQIRQLANMEARRCMDTLARTLSNGKANTLVISTPDTSPTVPNSQISFTGTDDALYTVTWSTSPLNTVHLLRTSSDGSFRHDSILATHVNLLVFSANMSDPALVNVLMQLTFPLDALRTSNSYYTILLPPRTLRMIAAQ